MIFFHSVNSSQVENSVHSDMSIGHLLILPLPWHCVIEVKSLTWGGEGVFAAEIRWPIKCCYGLIDSSVSGLEVSDFMQQLRFRRGDLLGWDREPKKLWPTLTRKNASEPWGFSCVGGVEVMENGGRFSGIVTSRHERGLWLKVGVQWKHLSSSDKLKLSWLMRKKMHSTLGILILYLYWAPEYPYMEHCERSMSDVSDKAIHITIILIAAILDLETT